MHGTFPEWVGEPTRDCMSSEGDLWHKKNRLSGVESCPQDRALLKPLGNTSGTGLRNIDMVQIEGDDFNIKHHNARENTKSAEYGALLAI